MQPAADGLEYRILGPLEVWCGGREVDIGGRRAQTLLAVLLLHANDLISADQLVEDLWDGSPPASARATLRTHISHLRTKLSSAVSAGPSDSPLFTRGSSYGLRVASGGLDADRFCAQVDLGIAQLDRGDAASAAATLRDAVDMWRGPVLGELGGAHFAVAGAVRLEEVRLSAIERRMQAELAAGRHTTIVGEIEQLVAEHPLREALTGHLMVALYRSGRQADALAAYAKTRRRLVEELGLDPSPTLRDLEAAILVQDPRLDGPPATEPVRAAGAHQPVPALLDLNQRGPLVGREVELARLWEGFEHVERGSRRVAVVSGESGVGKTRLAAALAGAAHQHGATVLAGQCDRVPLVAYQPVVEALRAHLSGSDGAPDLVGATVEPSGTDTEEGGERVRYRLFEWVDELLVGLATNRPVVLVLDDLHWADRSTMLLFHHLARSTRPGAVFLVGLSRVPAGDDVLAGTLAELRRDRQGVHVALAPLAMDALAELVEGIVGTAPPDVFVRDLQRLTDGNPFYAEEAVSHLVETGALRPDGPWPAADTIARSGVPLGLQEVIRGRLAGLEPPVLDVLRAAAVLGRDAEFDVLRGLIGLDEDATLTAVEESLRLDLLVETGESWSAGYSFRHELLRQTVYEDTSVVRRQRLHLRAAGVIESREPPTSSAGRVAAHLRAAGSAADPGRVIESCIAAADAAERVFAWEEAARHVEGALDAMDRQGAGLSVRAPLAERAGKLIARSNVDHRSAVAHLDTALRGYEEVGDDEAAARVHSRLGLALSVHPTVMDIPRAIEHYERAAPWLCAEPQSLPAYHLHVGRGSAAIFALRTDDVAAAAEIATSIAEHHGDRRLWGWAAYQTAWAAFNRGQLAACDELHRQIWDEALALDDHHLAWMAAFGASLYRTMYIGDPRAAADWSRRALALPGLDRLPRQRLGMLDQLAVATGMAGDLDGAESVAGELGPDAVAHRMLSLWRNDWPAAERLWAEALERDTAAGDRLDAVVSAYWLGQVLRRSERTDEAGEVITRGLAMAVEGPQVPSELGLRAEAARLAAGEGRLDDAADHLARGHEILANGERWGGLAGQAWAAEAASAVAAGDRRRAESSVAMALDTFRGLSLPWAEAEVLAL